MKKVTRIVMFWICVYILWSGTIYSYAIEDQPERTDTDNCHVEEFNPLIDEEEERIKEYLKSREDLIESSEEEKENVLRSAKNASFLKSSSNILHSGSFKNIEWTIDEKGLLMITGEGEYKTKNPSETRVTVQPWYNYVSEIKSAKIDIKNTHDFSEMFWKCSELESVEFIGEQTLYPYTMEGMFQGCYQLKSIKWGKIDTQYLEDTRSMFGYCRSLDEINLNMFDTSKVEDMSYMFNGCNEVTEITLDGKFSTISVENMQSMFMACFKVKRFDLQNFDTSNVKNMSSMFGSCISLENINWGNKIDTSSVEDMSYMFSLCGNITELNLYKFNCSSLKKTNNMLDLCYKLKKVIGPQNMKDADIDLYVDTNVGFAFEWIDTTTKAETEVIPNNSNQTTYVRTCKFDHWDRFKNTDEYFKPNNVEDYYFITENDFNRLISKLPAAEIVNILGNSQANYYRTLRNNGGEITEPPIYSEKWTGSCYGMSCWVALQNNKWVTLPSGLKGVALNHDIKSKINYYQYQQKLTINCDASSKMLSLDDKGRLQSIVDAFHNNERFIISYDWDKYDVDSSTGTVSEDTGAHSVCAIAMRNIMSTETETDTGKDISNYKYCAIVYDPASEEVSTHSDNNIYFNEDGSFYIPNRELNNKNARIRRVETDKEHINAIDYYTGNPSTSVLENYASINTIYMRLDIGKQYTIESDTVKINVDDKGRIENAPYGVNSFLEECDSENISQTVIICLPESNKYTVSSSDGFKAIMIEGDYSTYASVSSCGKISFLRDGSIQFECDDQAEKNVYIGINENRIDSPWKFIYFASDEGKTLTVNISKSKLVVEGDNLSSSEFFATDNFDDEYNPIIIPSNTTKAEVQREGNNIEFVYNDENIEKPIDSLNDDTTNKIIEGFDVAFEISDSWSCGYNAKIRVENKTNDVIDNWKLAFEYDGEISNIWNAEILSHEGNVYTIKNVGWNQDIEPGQIIEFGISGQEDFVSEPTEYVLMGGLAEETDTDYDISVQICDDWGGGCNGNITITNKSDSAIEDWVLEFDFGAELTSIWNADIVSHEGSHYIIKNAQYNANIQPGQSVSVGFNGGEGAGTIEPTGYKLYSYGY